MSDDKRRGASGDLRPLVDRLAKVITVSGGRRAGDPETRVQLDHRMPAGDGDRARWRLMTSDRRLYLPSVAREPLSAWRAADGAKGRRLLAVDLADDETVAAILSWHFEPGGVSRRPHLVTSAAAAQGTDLRVRDDSLAALELLFLVVLAIDARTVRRGSIGVVVDNAVDLSPSELVSLRFARGSRRGGYRGDYWRLRFKSR